MDWGGIIKRAWAVTWQYKALWVLGIFAGISGCQPGGGSSGGNSSSSDFSQFSNGRGAAEFERFLSTMQTFLPAIFVGIALLVALGLVWSIFAIAARGGLVVGANAFETGAKPRLGELWGIGFSKFWTLVGLDILLKLPIVAVALGMAVAIFVPIFGAVAGGGDPGPQIIAPLCGSLVIGLPLLLVMSFVLGIMYLIALRYVMLGQQGAVEAAGNGWRFLRNRFKDTFVMWLLSGALNLGGSMILAIPLIVIAVGVGIPMVGLAVAREWGAFVGAIALLFALISLLSIAYSGVWGTFSSAVWTMFFRDVTGMSPQPVVMQPAPAIAYPPAYPPAPYQPPVATEPLPPVQPPVPPQPPVESAPTQPPAPPTDV